LLNIFIPKHFIKKFIIYNIVHLYSSEHGIFVFFAQLIIINLLVPEMLIEQVLSYELCLRYLCMNNFSCLCSFAWEQKTSEILKQKVKNKLQAMSS